MRVTKISLFILLFLLSEITGCSEREEARVETKDLVQGVYASGQVLPENYYRVNSKVSRMFDVWKNREIIVRTRSYHNGWRFHVMKA